MRAAISRRNVLRALGASSVGAALVPWIRSPAARAAPEDVPLRIVFISADTGMLAGSWEPTGPGGVGAPSRFDFDLGRLMEPLAPYKERMILFENLDMVSTHSDPTGAGNAHQKGSTHALVADYRSGPDLGGNVSIDQYIAQQLNDPEPLTYLPSLEVCGTSYKIPGSLSYSGPGQQVPILRDCPEVWSRLFPFPLGDAEQLAQRRTSAFDFIKGEHERLLARLPAAERTKLQQHLDERHELHQRLFLQSSRAANRPPESIIDPYDELNVVYGSSPQERLDNFNVISELNLRLVAAGLHTDTMRVATVTLSHVPDLAMGFSSGDFGANDWHGLDHMVSGENPELSEPAARGVIEQMQLRYTEKIRFFLDHLATLEETDGSSLLDHTVVVVVSHIADGSHSVQRLPWTVIGDAHGYFRTGQVIHFDRVQDPVKSWIDHGRPHNDLFVSLANAMGITTDTFGRADVCTGPIDQMRA